MRRSEDVDLFAPAKPSRWETTRAFDVFYALGAAWCLAFAGWNIVTGQWVWAGFELALVVMNTAFLRHSRRSRASHLQAMASYDEERRVIRAQVAQRYHEMVGQLGPVEAYRIVSAHFNAATLAGLNIHPPVNYDSEDRS